MLELTSNQERTRNNSSKKPHDHQHVIVPIFNLLLVQRAETFIQNVILLTLKKVLPGY